MTRDLLSIRDAFEQTAAAYPVFQERSSARLKVTAFIAGLVLAQEVSPPCTSMVVTVPIAVQGAGPPVVDRRGGEAPTLPVEKLGGLRPPMIRPSGQGTTIGRIAISWKTIVRRGRRWSTPSNPGTMSGETSCIVGWATRDRGVRR